MKYFKWEPHTAFALSILLFVLLSAVIWSYFFKQKTYFASLDRNIECLTFAHLRHVAYQQNHETMNPTFAPSAPSFLSDTFSRYTLLQEEKNELDTLFSSPYFFGNEQLEQRYHFLTQENALNFVCRGAIKEGRCQELTWELAHPVEINATDIKNILGKIENLKATTPECIILDCHLTQLKEHQVYRMSLKLLQREYP